MTNLKKFALFATLLVLVALLGLVASDARAVGSLNVSGTWAGTAFANPELDIDGDGISGRQFDLHAYGQLSFSGIEGALDSHVTGEGCAGPDSYSLKPLGTLTLRGRLGDSLYANFDPSAPDICFDIAHPGPEVIRVVLAGGTGAYASATGTGTFVVHDVARLTRPVSVPGLGVVPAPTMIDTRGEFSLSIR